MPVCGPIFPKHNTKHKRRPLMYIVIDTEDKDANPSPLIPL
jgi:hypothetical protein